MASLDQHQSNKFVKLLSMGDPSSGKSGALTSLVKAGYKLAILDYDNGLDSLKQFAKRDCPQNLTNVYFKTLQDKWKPGVQGATIDGMPVAFARGVKLMDNWTKLNGADEDLGKPGSFGPEWVFVLDSLTFFSDACYDYFDAMNPGCKDKRQIYGLAQEALANILDLLMSVDFKCHVVINAHLSYQNDEMGVTRKGFARSIGQALNTRIASWFNSAVLFESTGTGQNVKKVMRLTTNGIVELRNPAPFKLAGDTLPIDTALATFFKAVLS
jgi:hypothetical protein